MRAANKCTNTNSYTKASALLLELEQEDAALSIQSSWRGARARVTTNNKDHKTRESVIKSSQSEAEFESDLRLSTKKDGCTETDMQKLPPLKGAVNSLPKIGKDEKGHADLLDTQSNTEDRVVVSPDPVAVAVVLGDTDPGPSPAADMQEHGTPEASTPAAGMLEQPASSAPDAVAEDEDEKDTPGQLEFDLEESRRDVNAAIVEKAASARMSSKEPVWVSHDEIFVLPNGIKWPDLTKSDADVYDWVHTTGSVLTRMVTWNLMASPPPTEEAICMDVLPKNKFHVYAIGTEECERTIAQSAINTNKDHWEGYLKTALGPMYHPVKSCTLQAIHLMVFVHKALLPMVSDIRSGAVATGLGNRLGNKGAVGIRLTVGRSRILVVNAHLAAHQNAVKERNAQFKRIETELSQLIKNQDSGTGAITDALSSSQTLSQEGASIDFRDVSDRIFFMGDLNYRIRGTRDMVELLISKCMVEVMINNDQLSWSMRQNLLPQYLQEAEIKFKPTYKFNQNSDVYDTSKKRRTPGWTDRVLFEPTGLMCLHYGAVMDIRTSDHRPVFANFALDLDLSLCEKPQFDESGNHGHTLQFTSDSQVCAIM